MQNSKLPAMSLNPNGFPISIHTAHLRQCVEKFRDHILKVEALGFLIPIIKPNNLCKSILTKIDY